MVTASHNPGKYNGFKFTREKAIPISGDTGIKDIEKLAIRNRFKDPKKKGKIIKKDITKEYKKSPHLRWQSGVGRETRFSLTRSQDHVRSVLIVLSLLSPPL